MFDVQLKNAGAKMLGAVSVGAMSEVATVNRGCVRAVTGWGWAF